KWSKSPVGSNLTRSSQKNPSVQSRTDGSSTEPPFPKRRGSSSSKPNRSGLCPNGLLHVAYKRWPKHGQRWSKNPATTRRSRPPGRIPSVHARMEAWSGSNRPLTGLAPFGDIPSVQARTGLFEHVEGRSECSRSRSPRKHPSIQSRMEAWSESSRLLASFTPLGRMPSVQARTGRRESSAGRQLASLRKHTLPSKQGWSESPAASLPEARLPSNQGWSESSRLLAGFAPLGLTPSVQAKTEERSESLNGHQLASLPRKHTFRQCKDGKDGPKIHRATDGPRSPGRHLRPDKDGLHNVNQSWPHLHNALSRHWQMVLRLVWCQDSERTRAHQERVGKSSTLKGEATPRSSGVVAVRWWSEWCSGQDQDTGSGSTTSENL
ncbi:hypothetical protein BGZ79_003909, partial [Entomortierella chlamydospora]